MIELKTIYFGDNSPETFIRVSTEMENLLNSGWCLHKIYSDKLRLGEEPIVAGGLVFSISKGDKENRTTCWYEETSISNLCIGTQKLPQPVLA